MLKKVLPFLTWLPQVKHTFKDDLIAGITGTIIVIPQAVAFAMIAGLPPVYGFYTAMITPIVAALFRRIALVEQRCYLIGYIFLRLHASYEDPACN